MAHALKVLEAEIRVPEDRRAGDFRPGMISVNYRKCGKKNCTCAKPGHPGHGPQYLWNTTIKGKSYAKNLRFGPELQKYVGGPAKYRGFVELCHEVVKLNEKVCDLRPIATIEGKDEPEELKKIRTALQDEIEKEVDRIVGFALRDRERLGHVDFESLKVYLRSSMHSVGSMMWERWLNADGGDYGGRSQPCEKGHGFEFKEYWDKKVLTVSGPIALNRAYYYDEKFKKEWCPKDIALDIEGTSLRPGVRRIVDRVGASDPFALGHQDIKEMAGL